MVECMCLCVCVLCMCLSVNVSMFVSVFVRVLLCMYAYEPLCSRVCWYVDFILSVRFCALLWPCLCILVYFICMYVCTSVYLCVYLCLNVLLCISVQLFELT